MKTYELKDCTKAINNKLAWYIRMQDDGNIEDDPRLHKEDIITRYELDKVEYEKIEKAIEDVAIEWDWRTVYAWCDVSGYNYRMESMEEHNYIQVSVSLDKKEYTEEEIEEIAQAIDDVDSEMIVYEGINMNWIN